jgi:hypothetical protein
VNVLAKNITFTAPEYLLIGEDQEPMRKIAFLESPTTTVPFSRTYDMWGLGLETSKNTPIHNLDLL